MLPLATTSMRRPSHPAARPGEPGGATRPLLLPDALRGAGADPLCGRLRRLPLLLHELRPARELPRCRCGIPPSTLIGDLARWTPFLLLALKLFIAGFPVSAGRIDGQRVLQGSFGLPTAADVDLAPRDLRALLRRDGLDRPGRREALRRVRAARGLPAGHRRQRAGHRRLLRDLVPPGAARGLGHRRRGAQPAGRSRPPIVGGGGGERHGRRAGGTLVRPGHVVVPLLPRTPRRPGQARVRWTCA